MQYNRLPFGWKHYIFSRLHAYKDNPTALHLRAMNMLLPNWSDDIIPRSGALYIALWAIFPTPRMSFRKFSCEYWYHSNGTIRSFLSAHGFFASQATTASIRSGGEKRADTVSGVISPRGNRDACYKIWSQSPRQTLRIRKRLPGIWKSRECYWID